MAPLHPPPPLLPLLVDASPLPPALSSAPALPSCLDPRSEADGLRSVLRTGVKAVALTERLCSSRVIRCGGVPAREGNEEPEDIAADLVANLSGPIP